MSWARPTPRIVGGSEVNPHFQYPFVASLYHMPVGIQHRRAHTCAGTLVAPTWVLTAAHCFDATANRPSATEYSALLYAHDVYSNVRHSCTESNRVVEQICHPQSVSYTHLTLPTKRIV